MHLYENSNTQHFTFKQKNPHEIDAFFEITVNISEYANVLFSKYSYSIAVFTFVPAPCFFI